ncbi:hypothetical protein SELMODRAFT_402223 [Selaginella moellendorffii]|uniref:RNase H type-1 domain-containing protein n=1 Tax=Selaginella moellendorffii TaxID=88036 RepID=D8QPZ3_SELML|nr:hypothetical protein SELMODRAFT_402223 [Selaginella moellendorffii]
MVASDHGLQAFTDGSFKRGVFGGYGVFIPRVSMRLACGRRANDNLHTSSTITFELLGLMRALEICLEMEWHWGLWEPVFVYTDSYDSLMLLEMYVQDPIALGRHPNANIIQTIVWLAGTSFVPVHFCKVKGHYDIAGNQVADELAKIGAHLLPGQSQFINTVVESQYVKVRKPSICTKLVLCSHVPNTLMLLNTKTLRSVLWMRLSNIEIDSPAKSSSHTKCGELYTWGKNRDYQLGIPGLKDEQLDPVPVQFPQALHDKTPNQAQRKLSNCYAGFMSWLASRNDDGDPSAGIMLVLVYVQMIAPSDLPDQLSTFRWEDTELSYLRASPLYGKARERLEMITTEFGQVQNDFCTCVLEQALDVWPQLFGKVSLEDLKHVYATVFSRSLAIGEDSTLVMIPMLDFFNHNATSFAKLSFNGLLNYAVVTADRDYAENDQIWINYGDLSNAELALDYGFTVPENPYDEGSKTTSRFSCVPGSSTANRDA